MLSLKLFYLIPTRLVMQLRLITCDIKKNKDYEDTSKFKSFLP